MGAEIGGQKIAGVLGLKLHPKLVGNNNSGSIAVGGSAHYMALYCSLVVREA